MCTSSEEGGLHHCFSLSGWIKIVESFAVFTLIMLHRIGAGVVNQMVRKSFRFLAQYYSLNIQKNYTRVI